MKIIYKTNWMPFCRSCLYDRKGGGPPIAKNKSWIRYQFSGRIDKVGGLSIRITQAYQDTSFTGFPLASL